MKLGLVGVLGVALFGIGMALARAEATSGESNGIPYISGGIGQQSREALDAKKGGYNVLVILSLKNGHYLGAAELTVRDRKGKTVLEIQAQGPWIMAKLAPGTYAVEAKAGNSSRTSRVVVGKQGLKRVHLIWDKEPV